MMSQEIIQITDLSREGSGVGRLAEGQVIFVPFALPGETIRVEYSRTEESSRYLNGRLLEVLLASPHRVEPRCRVFGDCGGCQLQHLEYSAQWELKFAALRKFLDRNQKLKQLLMRQSSKNFSCSEFQAVGIPAQNPWNYRNRIQLRKKTGRWGYFGPEGKTHVPIERCEIAHFKINEEILRLQKESSFKVGGSTSDGTEKVEIEWVASLKAPTPHSGELHVTRNSPHAALGFRQVNDEQNRVLQSWVLERLKEVIAISSEVRVLDLYGGSGNFSFFLAHELESLSLQNLQVDCVDRFIAKSAKAVASKSIRFHSVDVLTWLKRDEEQGASADFAILDPSREGLGREGKEIWKRIMLKGVKRSLLISCDEDSFSRDLCAALESGWQLNHWTAIDLFPQTKHVECLAVLDRAES